MDADDATMCNEDMYEWLSTRQKNASINYYIGNSKTKIQACNADLDGIEGDVLLLASDDMNPQIMGYDDIIFKSFEQTFPDYNGAIKFWDGLRQKEDPLMTLTVMGFPLYKQFGYVYNPEYTSVYCDDEQTRVCGALGKLARCDSCIIKHEWSGEAWDELHARNENKEMYAIDSVVFQRRLSNKFDMETMFNASISK